MHHHDLTKRYHVEVRYRRNGVLEDWEVSSTRDTFQDAEEDWWAHWRKNVSRQNIRILDTQKPLGEQVVYPTA